MAPVQELAGAMEGRRGSVEIGICCFVGRIVKEGEMGRVPFFETLQRNKQAFLLWTESLYISKEQEREGGGRWGMYREQATGRAICPCWQNRQGSGGPFIVINAKISYAQYVLILLLDSYI